MTKKKSVKLTNELLIKWHQKIDGYNFTGCSTYMQRHFSDASISKLLKPLIAEQEEYNSKTDSNDWYDHLPQWYLTDEIYGLNHCCGVAEIKTAHMTSVDHIKLACKRARLDCFGMAVATFNKKQEHLIPLFRRAGFKTGMGWTTNPVHNSKICLMVKAIDKL